MIKKYFGWIIRPFQRAFIGYDYRATWDLTAHLEATRPAVKHICEFNIEHLDESEHARYKKGLKLINAIEAEQEFVKRQNLIYDYYKWLGENLLELWT